MRIVREGFITYTLYFLLSFFWSPIENSTRKARSVAFCFCSTSALCTASGVVVRMQHHAAHANLISPEMRQNRFLNCLKRLLKNCQGYGHICNTQVSLLTLQQADPCFRKNQRKRASLRETHATHPTLNQKSLLANLRVGMVD